MSWEEERVYISNPKHPHYGESGIWTGEVIRLRFGGPPMWKVALDNCKHGTDGCFVSPGDIRVEKRALA